MALPTCGGGSAWRSSNTTTVVGDGSTAVVTPPTTTTTQRQLNPSILNNVKLLVLLVQFTDHTTDRTLPPKSHFESLCQNQILPYLQQQSYQLYTLSGCTVMDWATTDNTESYYSYNTGNLVGSDQASSMFLPVLRQLDQSGAIDFSQYDLDYDLTIDALLVIHSGYASEQGSGSACQANAPQNRIVSQGHFSSNPSVWTSQSGLYNIGGYAIASAYNRVCPGTAHWATYGVMTHEFIHTFNTPDLYDTALITSGTSSYYGGIASFDIMSNPFGPNSDGNGGGMSSCIKERIGWISPTIIDYDGTYTIRILNDYGDVYKITKGYATDTEYLLIEYRSNIGYDSALPGSGLFIYHEDTTIPQQNRAGFPNQSGWPQNGNHYTCALLPADGKYDLEQGINNGDSGDFWTPGTTLGPGPNVYPNTDSYQNGNIVTTGITITDITVSGTGTMTFRVSGLGGNGGTTTTTTTTPPSTSPPVILPPTPVAPVTNAPVTNPPVISAPVTNPPVTNPPVTNAPVTNAPATVAPTTVVSPPMTTMSIVPTTASVGITDEDDDGALASLENLSFIPSTTPSHVPVPLPVAQASVPPTLMEFNTTSSSSSSFLPLPKIIMTTFGIMTILVIRISW